MYLRINYEPQYYLRRVYSTRWAGATHRPARRTTATGWTCTTPPLNTGAPAVLCQRRGTGYVKQHYTEL